MEIEDFLWRNAKVINFSDKIGFIMNKLESAERFAAKVYHCKQLQMIFN